MLELWQTEWCPASHRVRERLTELGVDYVVHQVPVEKAERRALLEATGSDTIPALITGKTPPVIGEDAIYAYLDGYATEPPEATAHRIKAERALRRQLEEECECPPTTH